MFRRYPVSVELFFIAGLMFGWGATFVSLTAASEPESEPKSRHLGAVTLKVVSSCFLPQATSTGREGLLIPLWRSF